MPDQFTLDALVAMLDARERQAGKHSMRTRDLAVLLAVLHLVGLWVLLGRRARAAAAFADSVRPELLRPLVRDGRLRGLSGFGVLAFFVRGCGVERARFCSLRGSRPELPVPLR